MNKLPTVLVVDNSRAVTGALNALRHATTPLREQFGFVYVVPAGSTARPVLEADGYRVHELPFVEISRRPADLLRYLPLLLLSLGRLPVLTHVRFLPQALPQAFARPWRWLAEHLAQRVLCVSDAVRAYFAPGHGRVQTVYDPLPARGEKLPTHAVAEAADAPVRLLYLSNYIRGKGQNFAVEAFRQAYAQCPRLRLHFVGGDMGLVKNQEFRQELEATVRQANLAGVVTFAGFASDTEDLMKAHDVVLNFSEAESFSLTCLDALYYGVPLIASDCGGPAELFEANVSGLLVPNRDVAAMVAAMVQLAENAGQRRAFAQASRAFVRQKFAPAHTYLRLADCYRAVIQAGGK